MKFKKYTRRQRQHGLHQAVFESLEDRQLMSAAPGISFADGILTITGDAGQRNNISLSPAADGNVRARVADTRKWVKADKIHKVVIVGGEQADTIKVDPSLKFRTHIEGRGGNDVIYGGDGNDTIYGGDGNDLIDGRSGDDRIAGQDGNDQLAGGRGDDTVIGGPGRDRDVAQIVLGKKSKSSSSGDTKQQPSVGDSNAGTGSSSDSNPGTDSGSNSGANSGTDTSTDTTGGTTGSDTSGSPAADGTQAIINLLDSSVTAGNAVHARGDQSQLGSGGIIEAKYEWNFGDPNGKHNTLVGFNAAHIYDNAGTYTVTLKVTDKSGVVSTASAKVNVAPDTRRTIYVSRDGNDANTGLSPSQAVKSTTRAQGLLGSNTEVLFRRGDEWDVTESALAIGFNRTAQSNILIGAYGQGANPILKGVGTDKIALIATKGGHTSDVTVQDITFDSRYTPSGNIATSVPVNGVYTAGTNIAVRDCTFLNVGVAVNAPDGPTGILVQDNTAPLATGIRGNFMWASNDGTDFVVVGNTVANSTREHILRFAGAHRILIEDNNLTNLDRRSVDGKDYNKTTIVLQNGDHAYIADNTLNDGRLDVSTAMTPNSTSGFDKRGALSHLDYAVIENNTINNAQVNVLPNAHHVMIRDNVIRSNAVVFDIFGADPYDASRMPVDINIVHNTGITTGAGGDFLTSAAGAQAITVRDNTYAAPNNDRVINFKVTDSDLRSFTLISHNTWSIGSLGYVGLDGSNQSPLKSSTQWEAYSQVQGDVFTNVTLPVGNV